MSQNMMKLLVKLSNHINDKCYIINYGIFVEKIYFNHSLVNFNPKLSVTNYKD